MNISPSEKVLVSIEDGIAIITINNPAANTWDLESLPALEAVVNGLNGMADVRALVITGQGEKFFSAGADLNQFASGDPVAAGAMGDAFGAAFETLADYRGVSIAAINGYAMGGGLEVALACDIRIASNTARFGQTFAKRGLHPDWGGTYFLPRLVGMAKACELIFTGKMIDAAEALRLGIVTEVTEPEGLLPKVHELAAEIAAGPPIAIRLARRAMYKNADTSLREALEFETFAQNICRESDDAKEGIRAFVEKRNPEFRGS